MNYFICNDFVRNFRVLIKQLVNTYTAGMATPIKDGCNCRNFEVYEKFSCFLQVTEKCAVAEDNQDYDIGIKGKVFSQGTLQHWGAVNTDIVIFCSGKFKQFLDTMLRNVADKCVSCIHDTDVVTWAVYDEGFHGFCGTEKVRET